MNIHVKLIGRYKEVVGNETLSINLTSGNTVRDVVDYFAERYPVIRKDRNFILVSRNGSYTSSKTEVTEGDEILISPPLVSGG